MQALASERELVHALFDVDAADNKPTTKQISDVSENSSVKTAEPDFTFVLDRIFEGVCRPFKVRVEQVLQSQPSLIISYKLTNTLEFYSYTVSFKSLSILLHWLVFVSAFCFNGMGPPSYSRRSRIYLDETLLSVIHFGCWRMRHRRRSSTFLKPEEKSFYDTLRLLPLICPHLQQSGKVFLWLLR